MLNQEAPNKLSEPVEGVNQSSETYTNLAQAMQLLTRRIEELLTRFDKEAAGESSPAFTCPKCGSPMRLQTGPYGDFWSCTTYRETGCRGSRNLDGGVGRKSGQKGWQP